PVELRYDTITVEDGALHVSRDVYDKKTNTEDNLRAVLEAYGVSLDQLSDQERTEALNAVREMSRDASGKPIDTAAPSTNNTASKKSNSAASGMPVKVTRDVKGQKEVVVQI